ncbi:hypothetical protein F5Y14DRAFT_421056 [Nemania sp. NC0429]|nr:hypothetical protein F5Y14DRAFT_421056 [Nemania sp. NC0429]
MASSTDLDALGASLAKAKAYYNDKHYSKATAIFKQIIDSCICGVQARTSPCCCKSLVPAITDGAVEAELRKKCLCSAKSDVRCKSAMHINALDGLAAVYEAKGQIDTALVVAEAMINLAPREPKGYLRLGRLLRLQRSYHPAFRTYKEGIELVAKKNSSHPLLSTLHKMRDKVKHSALATDPLPLMPLELVAMIFADLDFRSLCKCLRVSKSWKSVLTTADKTIQSLWRVQNFSHCAKPVRAAQLQKYAMYSGSAVTQLVIRDCRQFGLDANALGRIATSYRSLKILKLQASGDLQLQTISRPFSPCVPRLTSLYLGFYAPFVPELVNQIITSSADTLQELTLLNLPGRPIVTAFADPLTANWPILQKLRTLRLGSRPYKDKAALNMASYMHTSPNVEEVWLEGISPTFRNASKPANPWPRLKRLFMGRSVNWQEDGTPFPLSSDIEELHLMSIHDTGSFLTRPWMQNPDAYPMPKNLKRFTLRDLIPDNEVWPAYLERWVRPGLESGSLKDLGMMFSKPHPDWLRSYELRFLSLKGLSLEFGTDQFAIDEALSDLLERFPRLEGLDIAQEPFSNAALARAIQRGVKTIYFRGTHYARAGLRDWALENPQYNALIIEGDYIRDLPMSLPNERYNDFY